MQLIALIILVLLSAFFSSAETSLTTVNRVRLKTLAEEGNRRAKTALEVLDKYGKMLSAILIGNNIVNLSASALATTLAIHIHFTVGIATAILTVVILIFGEIVPKNMAMINSEKMALLYASMISGLMKLLTPLIFVIDSLAKGIMKLFRIHDQSSLKSIHDCCFSIDIFFIINPDQCRYIHRPGKDCCVGIS